MDAVEYLKKSYEYLRYLKNKNRLKKIAITTHPPRWVYISKGYKVSECINFKKGVIFWCGFPGAPGHYIKIDKNDKNKEILELLNKIENL